MTISAPPPEPEEPAASPDTGTTTPESGDAAPATPGATLAAAKAEEQVAGAESSTSEASAESTPGGPISEIGPGIGSGSNAADEIPKLHLHSIWQDLMTGLGFFTRLPVRPGDMALSEAARLFSVIGALIGLGATLIYVLGLWIGLSSLMSAILAIAATALVTGALHEDGLADFADMLGVRGDRLRKLSVMRDSTIGSYGTLALIFISLMKVAALMELAVPGQVAGALISAHALGRGVLPLIMRTYPLARSNGLAVHAGKPPVNGTYLALVLGAVIAGLVGGPGVAFVATISALATAFLIAHLAYRQLGGYTGDVLGAAEQIVEVTVIMNFVSFT
jgi:adenosylcobinamide-GDP ribazoletransferase